MCTAGHPIDLNALKQTTLDEITNISEETLWEVMRRFSTRVHLRTAEGGGQLKDTVHKTWTMETQFKHNSKL